MAVGDLSGCMAPPPCTLLSTLFVQRGMASGRGCHKHPHGNGQGSESVDRSVVIGVVMETGRAKDALSGMCLDWDVLLWGPIIPAG